MQNEDQIFRLNKRIKELIAIYEKTLAQNVQLDNDHERLTGALATSDEQLKRVHQLNVQYKHELDKLSVDRDQQQKVQHQLKIKLNETMSICREQNNEIATLKRSLQNQRAISMAPGAVVVGRASAPAVVVTGAAEDAAAASMVVIAKDTAAEECKRLRNEVKQLEDELQESYVLIDDLEFEVEQIAYLEAENERLQKEIIILQAGTASFSQTTVDATYASVAPHQRQPIEGIAPLADAWAADDDENDDLGVDVVDKPVKQRRDVLHRKVETLQMRQSRRSDNLTERFQRGLSMRLQPS